MKLRPHSYGLSGCWVVQMAHRVVNQTCKPQDLSRATKSRIGLTLSSRVDQLEVFTQYLCCYAKQQVHSGSNPSNLY